MYWSITANEEDTVVRMKKPSSFKGYTMRIWFMKNLLEKPLALPALKKLTTGHLPWAKFVGKGYGKQIVLRLLEYCRQELCAKVFIYSTREKNAASIALAGSLGFRFIGKREQVGQRSGEGYTMLNYSIKL